MAEPSLIGYIVWQSGYQSVPRLILGIIPQMVVNLWCCWQIYAWAFWNTVRYPIPWLHLHAWVASLAHNPRSRGWGQTSAPENARTIRHRWRVSDHKTELPGDQKTRRRKMWDFFPNYTDIFLFCFGLIYSFLSVLVFFMLFGFY